MEKLSLKKLRYIFMLIFLLIFVILEIHFMKNTHREFSDDFVEIYFYLSYIVKNILLIIGIMIFSDYLAHRAKSLEY